MTLYHRGLCASGGGQADRRSGRRTSFIQSVRFLWLGVLLWALAGCAPPRVSQGEIEVRVTVEERTQTLQLPPGSTVQEALNAAGLTIGSLDRTEPPSYTVLTDGVEVHLVRVREEFVIEQQVIPFEHQDWRNETMPEGETRLIQPGVNGLNELTIRKVFEDGQEISSSLVKVVTLREPVPEIVMVGSQSPIATFPIPGRLAYLLAGNAWLIEGNTGNRRPVITTGDLDGRVFALSPDAEWLLYTRGSKEEDTINTLWAVRLDEQPGEANQPVDLQVKNVVHFAGWRPNSEYVISYSTVEPRASAPGWQANNDLQLIAFSDKGVVKPLPIQLETNMGGDYGWWGMTFAWAPDGKQIAYARPDGVGLLALGEGTLTSTLDLVSLQTRRDWAWVPGLTWSPDSKTMFTVDHAAPPAGVSAEESPLFDLAAIPLETGPVIRLVSQAGMFAYPLPSPVQELESGEQSYQVAYLQANFPAQSETSRYQVVLMDRDGSNRRTIFPAEGALGIEPQSQWGVWSPEPVNGGGYTIAVIYQQNLWLVDPTTGTSRQVTGDDMVTRVDWH